MINGLLKCCSNVRFSMTLHQGRIWTSTPIFLPFPPVLPTDFEIPRWHEEPTFFFADFDWRHRVSTNLVLLLEGIDLG